MRLKQDRQASIMVDLILRKKRYLAHLALTSLVVGAMLLSPPLSVVFGQMIEVPPEVLPRPINDRDAVQILNATRPMELAPRTCNLGIRRVRT